MERKIIHIDMDYFFAQVEELERPELKKLPVGIGAPNSKRGVLCTCNYVAREYGVRSAMPNFIALEKCPNLVLIPPHFHKYKAISEKVFDIFYEYTDLVQGISLDEAYLDVTDCPRFNNSATLIAQDIKKEILKRTKLTASAGVSYNKLISKIASEYNKPDGLTVVTPDQAPDFIKDLSLKEINGVGSKTFERMKSLGLNTFADIRALSKLEIENNFGNFAESLYNYTRGVDHRPVTTDSVRKSVSCEWTFKENISSMETLIQYVEDIYEELQTRLDKHSDREIKSHFLKVKYADFTTSTVEHRYPETAVEHYIELLKKRAGDDPDPIRLLGIGVRLADPVNDNQLTLEI